MMILPAVFNHLWQSTAFAAMAGLLALTLRKNHARVRHGVWLAASIKFLIPISLLMSLGNAIPWHTAPQIVAKSTNALVVMHAVSQPFTFQPAMTPASTSASLLPAVLLAMWLCGFIAIGISWYARWRRIRAVVRAGSPVQLNLPLETILCHASIEPGVFGVFHPVLMLPGGLSERLTPTHLDAVIAHELCHFRHRDNLVAAFHMFVETVFWFHPLVWWIGKRMLEERERACDEEVLRTRCQPRVYAGAILRVCRLYAESPLPCVAGVTGADLKMRIAEIMANRTVSSLSRARKLLLAMAAVLAVAAPVAIGLIPAFEVASVRASTGDSRRMYIEPAGGGRFTARNVSLSWLVQFAYNLEWNQIAGGPAWMTSSRFDVTARAEKADVSADQIRRMVGALLAERFALKFHTESRDLPIYTLVSAKSKAKAASNLHRLDGCPVLPAYGGKPLDALPLCHMFDMPTAGQLTAYGVTMEEFANTLTDLTHRTVRDRTGIPGAYDFRLSWTPDDATPGAVGPRDSPAPDPTLASIFTALTEQLGLKLQSDKGPVDVYVIDHAEKPSEN